MSKIITYDNDTLLEELKKSGSYIVGSLFRSNYMEKIDNSYININSTILNKKLIDDLFDVLISLPKEYTSNYLGNLIMDSSKPAISMGIPIKEITFLPIYNEKDKIMLHYTNRYNLPNKDESILPLFYKKFSIMTMGENFHINTRNKYNIIELISGKEQPLTYSQICYSNNILNINSYTKEELFKIRAGVYLTPSYARVGSGLYEYLESGNFIKYNTSTSTSYSHPSYAAQTIGSMWGPSGSITFGNTISNSLLEYYYKNIQYYNVVSCQISSLLNTTDNGFYFSFDEDISLFEYFITKFENFIYENEFIKCSEDIKIVRVCKI